MKEERWGNWDAVNSDRLGRLELLLRVLTIWDSSVTHDRSQKSHQIQAIATSAQKRDRI